MQNMSKIYKEHNGDIITRSCKQLALRNCREIGECTIDGECQTMDGFYNCCVTSSVPQKVYFQLADEKWKRRYNNHKKAFNHKRYLHEMTLSSCVWLLKETLDLSPNRKWSVVRCASLYSNISKKCFLCLYKQLVVITYPRQHKLLNKRLELFCKCRHVNKYLSKNFRANAKW